MLRYIYFSSLLLFLNVMYCYEYTSDNEPNLRLLHRKTKSDIRLRANKEKFDRKRQDYEIVYDSGPVAQIDVGSFIHSPDTFEGSQPYEDDKYWKQSDNGAFLTDGNGETVNEISRDYQNLDINNIPEINIYSKTTHIVPQNIDLNVISVSDHNGLLDTYQLNGRKKVEDLSFGFGHNTEKKCALKNMKIPFFSRNKDAKTKEKEQKKRWLFVFGKSKKQTSSISKSDLNTEVPHVYNKVIKRSFKRLCPACRGKNMANEITTALKSRTSNDIIHNSRQYYQGEYNKQNTNEMELNSKNKNNYLKQNFKMHSIKDRKRLKKGIHLSIEEKQRNELEEIEKK